ncbi:MAG: hypothetical protein MJB14_20370 [Spirochaetes bacterium]|nr:hypothetical protein [Spirochaetota bacterium]
MKKYMILLPFVFLSLSLYCQNPIVYLPGMFDNGDQLNPDNQLVIQCNSPDGFYYHTLFKKFLFDQEVLLCSSQIVEKYQRLVVANLIGPYRTNISLELMGERLFCLLIGRAPKRKSYHKLTKYKGCDFSGTCIRNKQEIYFQGLIAEIWAKYGKVVHCQKSNNHWLAKPYLDQSKSDFTYQNPTGYFDHPDQIKLTMITHSSGGLALRYFIGLCQNENISIPVAQIVNLSVPQKGARMNYTLNQAFPRLIEDAINQFYENQETGSITINHQEYTYSELLTKTRIQLLKGDQWIARLARKIIGLYILYRIPFDGKKSVLANDPALHDLHPDHKFIKKISEISLPAAIPIINYKVTSPYAMVFENIGKYLQLEQHDGVVDSRDTSLSSIPNFKQLNITNIYVKKANHIPLPYIKPLFELEETINHHYRFLRILVKEKTSSKEKDILLIQAVFTAIMNEVGLDLDYFMEHENYSVIDYFAENPVEFK